MTTDHDPFFSPAPSPRALALGSDAEIGQLYRALEGTPHLEVLRRLTRAAYAGAEASDRQDTTFEAALTLLRESQKQAPTIEWALRRDALLTKHAMERNNQQKKQLGALLALPAARAVTHG